MHTYAAVHTMCADVMCKCTICLMHVYIWLEVTLLHVYIDVKANGSHGDFQRYTMKWKNISIWRCIGPEN